MYHPQHVSQAYYLYSLWLWINRNLSGTMSHFNVPFPLIFFTKKPQQKNKTKKQATQHNAISFSSIQRWDHPIEVSCKNHNDLIIITCLWCYDVIPKGQHLYVLSKQTSLLIYSFNFFFLKTLKVCYWLFVQDKDETVWLQRDQWVILKKRCSCSLCKSKNFRANECPSLLWPQQNSHSSEKVCRGREQW